MRNTGQEITDFQAVVEAAFDSRVSRLRDEIHRLSFIRDNSDEWLARYQSWTPSGNVPLTDKPAKPGKIDLSQFDYPLDRDFHVFGEWMQGHRSRMSSKERVGEVYPERKKNLVTLINLAEKYLAGFESYEKAHALTQYSIYNRKDYNWKGDENLAHPYRSELVCPEQQAHFLIQLHQIDQTIGGCLLSLLARINGSPSIMQAVGSSDYEKLVQLLSDSSVLVSEEITAWFESLNPADIKEIDDLLAELRSVKKDFFLQKSVPILDDLWDTIQALSYKEWPTIGNNDGAGNFRPSQENSHPNEYQEPDPEDAEERKQYFVGLKDALKNSNLLDQIVDALCARGDDEKGIDCIDVEDKAVLYYRFSGNKKPKELKKVKWHTKKSDRPGDNKKVRHPSELYYLLYHMYKGVSDVQERVNEFFAFEDDETSELVKSAFKDQAKKKKSGIGTKGQSAPQSFQATMNSICPMVFPIKNKKK